MDSNGRRADKGLSDSLLYVKTACHINDIIHEKEIPVGGKLLSERLLSQILAVGRNTVREAIRILENQGIVEVIPKKGSYVRALKKINKDNSFTDLFKGDYIELLELRILLEKHIASKLIHKRNVNNLVSLKHILLQMERKAELGIYDVEADASFHQVIISSEKNRMLVHFCTKLLDQLSSYAGIVKRDKQFIETIRLHRDIFESLVDKDQSRLAFAYEAILQADLAILEQI